MVRFRDMFQTAQEAVAVGLADEGVRVVFDATTPCADLENRVMHLRPLPEKMSPVDMEDCRGDVDHETGHFKYTDIETLKLVRADGCPFLKLLVNIVEDGRIERLMSDQWFGCAENIANSGERALQEMRYEDDRSDEYRKRRAMAGLTLLAFGHDYDAVLEKVGHDVDPYLEQLDGLLDDIAGLSTTFDVVRKAKDIRERWKEWAMKEHEPPPRPSKSAVKKKRKKKKKKKKGDGSKKKSKGRMTEEPNAKKEVKKKSKGRMTEEPNAKKEVKPSDKGLEIEAATPESGEKKKARKKGGEGSKGKKKRKRKGPNKAELKALAKKMAGAALADIRKKQIAEKRFSKSTSYVAFTEQDVIQKIPLDHLKWHHEESFANAVRETVPTMRRKMLIEFQGVGKRVKRQQRKGQLDERSLFKVALGSDRVFYRNLPAVETNAFVSLLVDTSASMNWGTGSLSRKLLSAQCASAMSQTLDGISVDHECLAFTSRRRYDSTAVAAARKKRIYDRLVPLNHLVVKAKRERWYQAKRRFPALGHYPSSSENIDGEGLLWAAKRIAHSAKDGAKPVLIVFSDGVPASYYEDNTVLNKHLERTVRKIERAGISVIGVGIQTDSVAKFYTNHVVINDLADMATEFFVILRKVLRETSTIRR